MLSILLRPRARADLLEIWAYIARDSEESVDAFVAAIDQKLQLLAVTPHIGRARDELEKGVRSFPLGRYVIFYRTASSALEIIRVLHAARDVDAAFGQDAGESAEQTTTGRTGGRRQKKRRARRRAALENDAVLAKKLVVFHDRLGHRAGTQAAGAHRHGGHLARRQLGPNLDQVGRKATLRLVVGVADVVAALGLLAAMLANLGHDKVPPENRTRGSARRSGATGSPRPRGFS
jgi:toxin ParE1/3/4